MSWMSCWKMIVEMVQEQLAQNSTALLPRCSFFADHVVVTKVDPAFHIPMDLDDYVISDSYTYDKDHEETPYRKILFYGKSKSIYV